MKPHKHAKLIKAWADGAEIEQRYVLEDEDDWITEWHKFDECWEDDAWEYRIKPEPKVDVVMYGIATYKNKHFELYCWGSEYLKKENLKLTFDSETGELKSAEVLK